ncbi:MAG: glycoside hydrolase family 95 protein [Oscillospiraceae bacterium]|jgi:alpha-L-fucosidase 2|nr:glycoside hydrolase family 95 protein [Oscillospiraceae bacterium]
MPDKHSYKLTYNQAAERWIDALPMGNGRLGAMVYGHANIDRIQLNEDSLWYGRFIDRNNRATLAKLPDIQRAVLDGRLEEAEDLISRYMIGAPSTMRHYEPLGELDVALNVQTPFVMGWLPNSDGVESYRQELDLTTGVQTITHKKDGVTFTKEIFISHPDQVMAMRIKADKPGAIRLVAQMDRCRIFDEKTPDHRRPGKFSRGGGWAGMLLDHNHTISADTLLIAGNAAGVEFAGAVRAETDGVLDDPYTMLSVSGASYVTLYLAAATENREADPTAAVLAALDRAVSMGYETIKARHIADFESLMSRCTLALGEEPDAPTDVRIDRASKHELKGGSDPALAALYFMFGRYLMVAGGRADSYALNLQGIWCHEFIPSWDSKYTININTQMNYWPAETTNLSETHMSMFALIKAMREKGLETARVMYGCRGAVCHHNTDLYGDCAPQDVYLASTSWTTGGAWMALHLWEHYRCTLNLAFLREWYPVMRDFALFFVDFLIEDKDGALVTCPSLSPENRYILPNGHDTPICAGPAMDNQILRALFSACIEADKLLGLNDELAPVFVKTASRLPKNAIGSKGQLLEWREEVPEMTPGMGHISHLWGAYPGDEINWKDSPDLLDAARTSLKLRVDHGAGHGGWPLAWYICEHARMLNPEAAGLDIDQMMVSNGSRNFMNGGWHVFQIDGNLGATAGIAETLIQSHTGIIHLLPALPPHWLDGEAKGLVARGAVTADMVWRDGGLTRASLTPAKDGALQVRASLSNVIANGADVPTRKTEWGFSFDAKGGTTYILS